MHWDGKLASDLNDFLLGFTNVRRTDLDVDSSGSKHSVESFNKLLATVRKPFGVIEIGSKCHRFGLCDRSQVARKAKKGCVSIRDDVATTSIGESGSEQSRNLKSGHFDSKPIAVFITEGEFLLVNLPVVDGNGMDKVALIDEVVKEDG